MNPSCNNSEKKDILLTRYIAGDANEVEQKEIETWINEKEENRQYAESMKLAWTMTGTLTGDEGDIEEAWIALNKKIDAPQRTGFVRYYWMAAAVTLLIVAGIYIISKTSGRKDSKSIATIRISSGNEIKPMQLPDGSKVILEPHSLLSYPLQFADNKRDINLEGSAFFDVTHDPNHPFTINVNSLLVTVIGTSFHIDNNNDTTVISVTTGIVQVSNTEHNFKVSAHEQLIVPKVGLDWIKRNDTTIVTSITNPKPAEILKKKLPALDSLPVTGRPMHKMLVGDQMPILPLDVWIKGEPVDLFEEGKVYLVDFWALWCGPCIAGMERLSELQKKYKKEGLEVISVTSEDAWGNSFDKVSQFIKNKGGKFDYHFAWLPFSYNASKTYKSIIYNQWLLDAYDSSTWALPQIFLIDRKGKFAFIGDGFSLSETYLEKVLNGTHDIEKERKNYIDNVHIEFNVDRFLEMLNKKQVSEAIQLGETIINHPHVSSHALIAITDNLFNKYKELLNNSLLSLGFTAALKGVQVTDAHSPGHLSVLAKAYSLMNKRTEAISTIQQAIALSEGGYKDALLRDLKEYELMGSNK